MIVKQNDNKYLVEDTLYLLFVKCIKNHYLYIIRIFIQLSPQFFFYVSYKQRYLCYFCYCKSTD